jgi:hypothetical protein
MLATVLTLALAATAYALPSTAVSVASATSPDPSQVSITGITYGGTGCPQGSLGTYISADRQT